MDSMMEKLFPPLDVDDGTPLFFLAENARLASMRNIQDDHVIQYLEDYHHNQQQQQQQQQQEEDDGNKERLLCFLKSTNVSLNLSDKALFDVRGKMFVTTKRVFFAAHDVQMASFDFAMNAYCISLHALMSEPTHSVYCQLCESASKGFRDEHQQPEDEDPSTIEIVIQPLDDVGALEGNIKLSCQQLFDALSKLISLNPVSCDDEEGGMGYTSAGAGGLAAMLGFLAGDSAVGFDDEEHNEDEMIYRIDSNGNAWKNHIAMADGETIEEAERDRMLKHLDNLLVVPPEYDEHEGQFDDAEDESGSHGEEDII